jgi:hypothetical protein
MMITTAYSVKPLPEIAQDLRVQCGDNKPRFVLFFASAKYDPQVLSKSIQAAFPEAKVAGCSTAGEIVSGRMMTETTVAMFFPVEVVEDACITVVENLRDEMRVDKAFAEFEQHFRQPVTSLDLTRHVGVVLVDGLSGAEDRLMEKIGDHSDITFVGGAAGDDLKFEKTYVFAGGKAYTNAAVLILLRLKNGFEILKTQSFVSSGQRLTVTEVDGTGRKVRQFDDQPAVQAYAKALGVAPQDLPNHFSQRPLGLIVNGEPFVRSPRGVEGESVAFLCGFKEGTQLEVLEGTDIVADTRAAIAGRMSALGNIAGLVDFHCILRTLDLRKQGRCDEYGQIFDGVPAIGFSTYGEEYLGHMNQTSTMLLLR